MGVVLVGVLMMVLEVGVEAAPHPKGVETHDEHDTHE
jgi:hypothetical protein